MSVTLDRDALLRRLREDTSSATHRLAAHDALHLPLRAVHLIEAHLLSLGPAPSLLELMQLETDGAHGLHHPEDLRRLSAMLWWVVADALAERDGPREVEEWTGHAEFDRPVVVEGDLVVRGGLTTSPSGGDFEVLVTGDLVLEGSLSVQGGSLFVAGDVRVAGSVVSPRHGMGRRLVVAVGGRLRAGESVSLMNDLFARGPVEAPVVTFTGQSGTGWLMSGATAIYFDENLYSGWSVALPEAPCVLNDEMALGVAPEGAHRGDFFQTIYTFWPDDRAWTAALRETIHPDVLAACGLDDGARTSMSDDGLRDRLWEALNVEVRPLEERFTAHALEVFRNRVGPWRGGR